MSNEEGQEGSPSGAPSLSPLVTKVTIVSPPRRSTAGSAPPGKAVRADAAAAVPGSIHSQVAAGRCGRGSALPLDTNPCSLDGVRRHAGSCVPDGLFQGD